MKAKDNFRFLDNFDMTVVDTDGSERIERVVFGRWYSADKIFEDADDSDFVDIYFESGEMAVGVHKGLIECRGVKISEAETKVSELKLEEPEEFDDDEFDFGGDENVTDKVDKDLDVEFEVFMDDNPH